MEETRVPLLDDEVTSKSLQKKLPIGVIGTGNFAVAFTKCLVTAGYDVIIGSRRPGMRKLTLPLSDNCLCGVEVTTIPDCLSNCDVIFVAIHMEDFKETLGKHQESSRDKIVVDVSNREYRYAAHSNAEHLASVLPNAVVVKAFNSVPAAAFDQMSLTGRDCLKVFVASDSRRGRAVVSDIAKSLGFFVIDLGGLKSALFMEEQVLKTFTHWRVPLFLTFGIFNLWSLFVVYLYFIEKTAYSWEQVFLKVLNKPLCMTAITVLALTYLPGQLAAVLQVYSGTKHKRFPRVLDTWLKSRKQLGLIGYILVVGHVIASVLMLSPTYYSSWFHHATVTLPADVNLTNGVVLPVARTWMTWKGEAACFAGILAFILLSIVAVTSIPSVGESLNWSEWRWIHSSLSYFVLFMSVSHVCIMGAPGWAKANPEKLMKSITLLSAILPTLVLVMKLLFSCPPLSGHLRKIRRGWERNAANSFSCGSQVCAKSHDLNVDTDEEKIIEGGTLNKGCRCSAGISNKSRVHADPSSLVNSNCQCSGFQLETSVF